MMTREEAEKELIAMLEELIWMDTTLSAGTSASTEISTG